MKDKESIEIKNLLQQISIVVKNYDKIAEITGEKYNVFNVLGLGSDELSHSAIIANLLNVKGSHGQKELFLKLFIEGIQNKFTEKNLQSANKDVVFELKKIVGLSKFDFTKSSAQKEKYLGRVNLTEEKGGFVDILVSDAINNIIIENKIYASDQTKQLIRYYDLDSNAPIFYLNLDGSPPNNDSKGNLVENRDFFIITYRDDITKWLEKCIEKIADKPIIRETLIQYLNLVKKLTNQSNLNNMKNDLSEILINNYESFQEIINSENAVYKAIIAQATEDLKLILENNGFTLNSINLDKNIKYSGFTFLNDSLESAGIRGKFEYYPPANFYYGFYWIDKTKKEKKTKKK